jgi:hypothetical protein
MRFEYLVCMSQRGKVTHANGEWTGAGDPADLDAKELEAALGSCPDEEEYLNRLGQAGWELVAVDSTVTSGEIVTGLISNDEFEISGYRTLYLKRSL